MLGVFIAFILAGLVFQRPLGNAVGWPLDRVVLRFMKPKEDEKDSEWICQLPQPDQLFEFAFGKDRDVEFLGFVVF